MNLKQLETFYWIERLGSFSAAAERLFTTQSTVSMRIQELEQSLGVKLFKRSGRSVRLTPKGRELVPYVRQLIELTAEMHERIMSPGSLSGVIKLGVVEAVATTWLPHFIQRLQERYPNITLELEVALSLELTNRLHHGGLNVVFGMGQPPGPRYAAESLGSLQLKWFANPSLGITEGEDIPTLLEHWPFVTLDRHSYHDAKIQAWMTENKVRCHRIIVCNAMSIVGMLVKAGVGITLLPSACYERDVEEGMLQVVGTPPGMPPVEVFAMYPLDEHQPLTRLVTEVASEVSDFDRAETRAV